MDLLPILTPSRFNICNKKTLWAAVNGLNGCCLVCVCVCVCVCVEFLRVCVCVHLHVSQVMQAHGVHNVVFSSSATVYGDPQKLPIDESHPVGGCTNPYGKTKYFIEEMITDHCKAEKVGIILSLRPFKMMRLVVSHKTYCCFLCQQKRIRDGSH